MARYVEIDAEAIVRAASAHENDILDSLDPEAVECFNEDAGRHGKRGSAHDDRKMARPRRFYDRQRRVA